MTYVLVKVERRRVDRGRQGAHQRAAPPRRVHDERDVGKRTRSYWSSRTGVGAGFFTTAVLGVIVGFVVVGQILYSGTLQYIREYGTLKAMGAKQQRGRPRHPRRRR